MLCLTSYVLVQNVHDKVNNKAEKILSTLIRNDDADTDYLCSLCCVPTITECLASRYELIPENARSYEYPTHFTDAGDQLRFHARPFK